MKRGILIAVATLLIGLAGFCGYRYYQSEILPERQLDAADRQQKEIIDQIRPSVQTEQQGESSTENPLGSCEEINDDMVGWIYIPDTNIDLPIVQGDDNDFYLHNGVNGQYNHELGCPFLDYRCERLFSGFNSIVYGHHITKHRMFADIALFSSESFMQSHPIGYLTLPDGVHPVQFFAYLNVKSTAPAYHAVFVTDAEKQEYLEYLFTEAKYISGLTADDLNASAHLLLLSTCTYEFQYARAIFVGVIGQS